MDIETWFIERQELTGICRMCQKVYANLPDDDGKLIDALLEEWQPLWDCRPIVLAADDVHSKSILGEWCSLECLERDLANFFHVRDDHAPLSPAHHLEPAVADSDA